MTADEGEGAGGGEGVKIMYDHIIIGGGIAGMICGNYLVRMGKKVLVLEQSHHTGGNMSGFRRKGFYFDGGDQSFESMGVVFPILKELGLFNPDEWIRCRYRMISDDFDFFIDSLGDVENALARAFPDEPGIAPVFKEIRKVSRFLDENCSPWEFPLLFDFKPRYLFKLAKWGPAALKWLKYSYRAKTLTKIKNPELREWFSTIGYFRMPYIFFAGFWHIWQKDYWYPRGGMQAFHDRLADSFRSRGGEVRCNTSVVGINTDGKRVTSVKTASDEQLSAVNYIYAGDYKTLVNSLLDQNQFKPAFRRKIGSTRLTESIVAVYLGLDIPVATLESRLQAHHTFYFPNYQAIFPDVSSPEDIHSRMWVVVNFFQNENHAFAPAGKSVVVLQTYSSFEWADFWKNRSEDYPRTEEYITFKAAIGRELVKTAERIIPDLSEHIIYSEVGTPLSSKRFSCNTDGSTGGWCYDDRISPVFKSFGLNMFRTPAKNLYAAGHYTLWPGGVISAALSGKMVANLAAGKRVLAKLAHPGESEIKKN